MIIGDPYKLSIFIKTIKEWNVNEAFCNGILLFFVDGNIFPKEIVNATLKSEIHPLKEKLKNLTVDEKLYMMQKDKAFVEVYNITFPENTDIDNDYRFDITPYVFSDDNCFIFAVSNGEEVRFMAAELNYIIKDSRHELEDIAVSETFLTVTELDEIISELDIY